MALLDGWEPKTSSDQRVPRLSFHPKKGSTEWFEYEFEAPQEITTVGVYWFDEAQAAASFRNERKEILPQSWRVLAWVDNEWSEVEVQERDPGIERDQYNYVTFERPISYPENPCRSSAPCGAIWGCVGVPVSGTSRKV